MVASHTVPDLVFLNNMLVPVYAEAGILRDLGPQLKQQGGIQEGDFFPQALEAMRWKGKLCAVPRDLSNLVLYLNLDRFHELGLEPPGASWSREDFLKACARLSRDSDGDGKVDQWGIALDFAPLFWLPYLWGNGADLLAEDHATVTLDRPEAVQALQWLADLRHKHHVAPTEVEAGAAPGAQLFANGQAAMVLSGRWSVPAFRKTLTFQWDVAPFPAGPAGSIVDADGSGWAITEACREPEQAWKLLSHLAGREASQAFAASGLILPARKDVAESPLFLGGGPPARSRLFLEALGNARPMRSTPRWNEVAAELEQGLGPLWAGRLDAQEAVARTSRRLHEVLGEQP